MEVISISDVHRDRFMDIVKYYNDVVMSNTIIVGESDILKFQKKNFKIEQSRSRFLKIDKPSRIQSKSDFYIYILKKNEHLQSDLNTYNKQLTFFYNKSKFIYDLISIMIIVLSSSLTLVQGITMCFYETEVYSTITILVMSTSIAIMTSVLKFKNIKGTLEDIVKTKEKVHGCQAKIYTFDKDIKSYIFLSNDSIKGTRDVAVQTVDGRNDTCV